MTRQELADGIELFCNTAPEDMYLARYCQSENIDVFVWIFYTRGLCDHLPEDFDYYLFKGHDGLLGMGRFRHYMTTDGKFDKVLYLNPD